MIFLSVEDFFEKADACRKPERQEELEYARKMKAGDEEARERLVEGYLPQVAGYIRASRKEQLGMVLSVSRRWSGRWTALTFSRTARPLSTV